LASDKSVDRWDATTRDFPAIRLGRLKFLAKRYAVSFYVYAMTIKSTRNEEKYFLIFL